MVRVWDKQNLGHWSLSLTCHLSMLFSVPAIIILTHICSFWSRRGWQSLCEYIFKCVHVIKNISFTVRCWEQQITLKLQIWIYSVMFSVTHILIHSSCVCHVNGLRFIHGILTALLMKPNFLFFCLLLCESFSELASLSEPWNLVGHRAEGRAWILWRVSKGDFFRSGE